MYGVRATGKQRDKRLQIQIAVKSHMKKKKMMQWMIKMEENDK